MELRNWVSDNVFKLTGISEDNIVDFLIASAKKSKNITEFKKAALTLGLTKNAAGFVEELYAKVPRKVIAGYNKANDIVELLERNSKYEMILEEHEPRKFEIKTKLSAKQKRLRKSDRSTKEKEWRKSDSDSEYYTEDEILEVNEKSEVESSIEKDRREKLEFEDRLRLRDLSREEDRLDDLIAKKLEKAKAKEEVGISRDNSRYEYLRKREDQKLKLLQQEIADEESFFETQTLTNKELRNLKLKKKVLGLAKEREASKNKLDGYLIPSEVRYKESKMDSVLHQKFVEEDLGKEKDWELRKIEEIVKEKKRDKGDEFDYVFDERVKIEFVKYQNAQAKLIESLPPQISEKESKAMTMKELRMSLPTFKYREQLLEAIDEYQVLIIVGETGSGKTTQIPQYLVEAGYTKNGQKVGCTQPRRVAAMSVATRVAEETATILGREIGYSIRFEDCTSEKTVIKYMTDGMLLREFLNEPDLSSYSCLIIDEAHERTLHTDILFGLVKDIARFRPDLKLLISSATMDANKFSEYFDNAPIFNIPGRKYPVEEYYTVAPEANYLAAAITTVMTIHITQDKGDILLFLTGQDEIEQVQESLAQIVRSLGKKIPEMIVCPIYANLPSDLQSKIFEKTPNGARKVFATNKVVLSTNIAETSITIDGIVYVIDPGFCKQNNFNPKSGMESLVVVPASRASANQRKGRAGRVGPGKCFRLYTSWAYQNELEANTIPEIQRSNMSSTVLLLKSLGINDLMGFDFMDAPPPETLIRSLEQLYALGALNDRGELTKLGRKMAEFPIDPMLSKTLIASEQYKSMLSIGGSVFYRPKDKIVHADQARKNFFRPGGDHIMLLAVWNAWTETDFSMQWCYENFIQFRAMNKAKAIREQLLGLMERTEIELLSYPDTIDTIPIRKSFTAGFFYNTAKMGRLADSYKTVKLNQSVHIHPSSSIISDPPDWILYHELVLTTREFMRNCIEIEPRWLTEVAPHYYQQGEIDDNKGKKLPKGKGKSTIKF